MSTTIPNGAPRTSPLPTARITTSIRHTSPSPPWHTHLTIDTILLVLNRTLFHPWVALMLPLSVRAMAASYRSTAFLSTFTYAVLVNLYWGFILLSDRYAYGKPRTVDFDEEVIVVVGGKGGLGGVLSEVYALRGVRVAVLDRAVTAEEEARNQEGDGSARYYRCDISERQELERVWRRLSEEMGTPTVLVNCAATVGAQRVIDTSMDEIESIIRTNLLAHIHLTTLFLPPLLSRPTGGTLITCSSVLAPLGASHLASYTATKAALSTFHASLTAELHSSAYPPNAIRTILVAPGQLDTPLFANVRQKHAVRNFVAPRVEVRELAVRIVGMIDRGQAGEVRVPVYAKGIAWMAVLPVGVQRVLRVASGIDEAVAVGLAVEGRGDGTQGKV